MKEQIKASDYEKNNRTQPRRKDKLKPNRLGSITNFRHNYHHPIFNFHNILICMGKKK
jgi:hypothetical protein